MDFNLDNDNDGILDNFDQCLNEPETYNGYKDEDGCPDSLPLEQMSFPFELLVSFAVIVIVSGIASYSAIHNKH